VLLETQPTSYRRLLMGFGRILSLCLGAPLEENIPNVRRSMDGIKEWTVIVDSFASGVGTGKFDEFRECFRFDGAYPRLMNSDSRLQGNSAGRVFNNVACAGATTQDVLKWQFLDVPTSQTIYGQRPIFGKP
jgi:hypothetical protein